MTRSGGELLNRLDSYDSIGNFYAYVTHLCGYRAALHEGKIAGLSARGEPRYRELFASLIEQRDGRIVNKSGLFNQRAIAEIRRRLPVDFEHADLAASIQRHLEDVVVPYVSHWLGSSGTTRLCLSGGVFANVRLNQEIAQLPGCDSLFVLPPMGDGGLAAGAAFDAWRQRTESSTAEWWHALPVPWSTAHERSGIARS